MYRLCSSPVPPRVTPVSDLSNIVLWGDSFTIVFSISNAQPQVVPDGITWLFVPASGGNSTNLTRDTPDGFSFSEDRLELTINSISLENEGMYTMKAENPGGANQASVSIEVRGTCSELHSRDSILREGLQQIGLLQIHVFSLSPLQFLRPLAKVKGIMTSEWSSEARLISPVPLTVCPVPR